MRERKRAEEALADLNPLRQARSPAVLILEDHDDTRRSLTKLFSNLPATGTSLGPPLWTAVPVSNIAAARDAVAERLFDLQILDRMVPLQEGAPPSADAIEFLRWQRSESVQTPVIVLTNKNQLEHRTLGYESYADHYLGKPFERKELLAIVNAIMWRHDQEKTLIRGKLKINFGGAGSASFAGREIALRPMELRILAYLAIRDPQTVTREELLETVWRFARNPKTGKINAPGTTVVDVRISALRKEGLKEHGLPSEIVATVAGGWKLNASLVQQGWAPQ